MSYFVRIAKRGAYAGPAELAAAPMGQDFGEGWDGFSEHEVPGVSDDISPDVVFMAGLGVLFAADYEATDTMSVVFRREHGLITRC